MKKTLIISLVAATAVFAATNEEILKLYEGLPAGLKVSITDRQSVERAPGFDLVEVTVSDGKRTEVDVYFTKDNFIITDMTDVNTGESLRGLYNDAVIAKKVKEIYKQEKSENIIKLGNDPKKPTLIEFTDPECPYCRSALNNIEKELESSNLEIIFTPVHGKPSYQKAALVLKHAKNAKTDEEKIKIMRKYYDADYNIDENVSEKETKNIEDLANKYQNAGIRGVPYMLDTAKLK